MSAPAKTRDKIEPRDYVREFDAACDEICNRLADELEAIDRKYGCKPYDYSRLRMPVTVTRKEFDYGR